MIRGFVAVLTMKWPALTSLGQYQHYFALFVLEYLILNKKSRFGRHCVIPTQKLNNNIRT
jgi:hypothetical protein